MNFGLWNHPRQCLVMAITGVLSLCVFSPNGLAQDNPDVQSGAQKRGATSLEEILVTARRRRESLQETPIAVTAFSGEALRERGITKIGELTKSVPSVEITESVSNIIYIRGVGQRSAFARVDPTVGVYLDNVFLPRTDSQLMDTVDIENIQVLRGPQGTLFGKNTTGGAMVITLEKPNDTEEGYVFGSLGNYGHHQFRAAWNKPITDTLFSRFAFNYLKDDGFFEDVGQNKTNTSKGRTSAMAQLRWEPTTDLVMDTLFYYGKIDERLPGTYCTPINTDDALLVEGFFFMWEGDTDPTNPQAYAENCRNSSRERLGDLKSNLGGESLMDRKVDTYLLSTTLEYQVSETLGFKFIASARDELKGPLISSDQDGGPMNYNESFNTGDGERDSYSLEMQMTGTLWNDKVTYTAGIFGMRETNTEQFTLINALNGVDAQVLAEIAAGNRPSRPTGNGTTPMIGIFVDPILTSDFGLENQTLAAFVQSSWDVTEQFEFTWGLRYTEETRSSDLQVFGTDRAAVGERIFLSGLGFGPAAEGFNPYLGPLGWLANPVGLAMSLFPDADGDGFNDFPFASAPLRTDEKEKVFRKLTPMISMSYQVPQDSLPQWADTLMVYTTWSSGFKSGFFEPKGVDGLEQLEPEEVENREIGFKLEALQRSLRFNMAIYSMDFDNQQLIQVDADSNNNLVVIYQNAGQSEITGAEIEMQWMPTPGLMMNFSASNNSYKFTEFLDNDLMQAALGNNVTIDRSDEPFPVSPETTIAFGLQYMWQTDFGMLTPRIDYSYKSDIYYGLDDGSYTVYQENKELSGQSAFSVVDLRLSWQNEDGDLTATFYMKNALDKRYDIGIAAVGDSVATFFQTYGDPRRFGLELRQVF